MIVNYVLMYGTPYLKYREFETFEDVSKFLANKSIVNYSIFKKLEDEEEVEMIYRDSDIKYLEKEIKRLNNIIEEYEKWLEEHSIIDYECSATIIHEQMALSYALRYLKELKEGK